MLLADRFGGAFRVWTTDDRDDLVMLTLPIRRALGRVTIGREEHQLAAGRWGVIGTPARPHAFSLGSDYEALQLAFSRAELQAMLSMIAGVDRSPYLEFEPSIRLDGGGGAALARLVELVVSTLDSDPDFVPSPLVTARLAEAITTQLLTGLPHKHSALVTRPVRAAAPAYVRRAAEYLEANAWQPISVADVARSVGASIRTLQAGFRKHLGTSPTSFLQARRLELARRRLQSAPWSSVSEVALACGFEHLGRFSQLYRMRFGESPSFTRARALRK